MAHLTFQATTDGLYVHQMAGVSPEAAREAFAIPHGFAAWTAFALGALGDPDTLPDDLRARELARTAPAAAGRDACSAAGSASRATSRLAADRRRRPPSSTLAAPANEREER